MTTHGSLSVAHIGTRSPSARNITPRVLGEPLGDVAIQPAAAVVERRRQVPVIERDRRLDALLEQRVDQAVVEVEPCALTRPVPSGRMRLHEMLNRYALSPSSLISATSSRQRR